MSTIDQQALYGCIEALPLRMMLRSGPVSFELIGGRFGPVSVNGHEVWHGIAFLFRDENWCTPEPIFEKVEHQAVEGRFSLQLEGYIPGVSSGESGEFFEGPRIELHIQVKGDADGQLHFLARATPTHDLLTNRCGWVLMHPTSAAGAAVEIEHVDGRTSRSTFPEEVPAWPPFVGVCGVRHEYASGYWAEAQLKGEVYELEDQRNNADLSFKTYSRSNFMPRPYILERHKSWTREVQLRLIGAPPVSPALTGLSAPRWSMAQLTKTNSNSMRLGLAIIPSMSRAPCGWLLAVLADLRPSFLHLTLWPNTEKNAVDWSGVQALLQASGATLRLDLSVGKELGRGGEEDSECLALAQQLALNGIVPSEVAALPCGERAAKFLRDIFPTSLIGGGTPHFFAQLNRLEVTGGEDFMGFTVCPIVHSVDDETVMLGLQSLTSLVATARLRHPGRQWHIGPSALSARASPLGRQPQTNGQRRVPLAARDPRTRGLFGAVWLLGHLTLALRAHVQAVTLPPLVGVDGLWRQDGQEWQMTPSVAVLQTCLRLRNLQAHELQIEADGCAPVQAPPLAAVAGQTATGKQILLGNLSSQSQTLHWSHGGQWACLDAMSWVQFQTIPLDSPWRESGVCSGELVLAPYSLARIDLPLLTGD